MYWLPIERIRHSYRKRAVFKRERQDSVTAHKIRFDDIRKDPLKRHIGGSRECKGEESRECHGKICFRDQSQLRQHAIQSLSSLARGANRTLQHDMVDDLLGDEKLAELFFELYIVEVGSCASSRRPRWRA